MIDITTNDDDSDVCIQPTVPESAIEDDDTKKKNVTTY